MQRRLYILLSALHSVKGMKAGCVCRQSKRGAHAEQKRGEATSLEAESQQAEARAEELEQEAQARQVLPFRLSPDPREAKHWVQLLLSGHASANILRLTIFFQSVVLGGGYMYLRILRDLVGCVGSMPRARPGIFEEVRREAREAEEQAQLLQQDLQRKVRGCLLHKLRGVASLQQGLI